MAKTKNGAKLNIAIASLVVVIVGVASSRITDYANNKDQTKDTVEDVEELKTDGCNPSGVNTIAIVKFETKMDGLSEDVKELKDDFKDARKEQTANRDMILKAIHAKKDDSP